MNWLRKVLVTALVIAFLCPAVVYADISDDAVWEIGVEYQGAYDPLQIYYAWGQAIRLDPILASDDIAFDFQYYLRRFSDFSNPLYRGDDYAGEEDFKYYGLGGIDYIRIDAVDVGMWVGHGPEWYNPYYGTYTGWLAFYNNRDDHFLYPTNARWGDQDLDWIFLSTCNFLKNYGSVAQMNRLYDMMEGVHQILGFASSMYEHPYSGMTLAWLLTGQIKPPPEYPLPVYNIIDSWIKNAEYWQPQGKGIRARIKYYKADYGDCLPGFGFSGWQPVPWSPSLAEFYDYRDYVVQ
ncbi:MAG: DUF6345 domain-containing protein [Actinomycetota bacterium]|nr:DUF6345 domain-containing protein [Actinomycetota bacterium]